MKKQSKAKKSFAIVCFSLIAVLVIGGASYAAYHLTQPSNNTPNWANIGGGAEGGNDSSDTNIVEEPNVISILILGLDDEASLPDTMLAIYLDLDNHDVSIISIPRDTMVNITPELRAEFAAVGRPNSLPSRNEVKLNEIFTRGGVSTHGLTFVTNHIQ
ncbi:MAG: LCP family protein, partial [Defluviitaleaceae bacterium]|nr:LCP family protein [Defluviitaleaceae bacterium]